MSRFIRTAALAWFAAVAGLAVLAAAQKPEKDKPKGELVKTVLNVTISRGTDKKTVTITAVGQVPTGGWKDARLTPKATKEPPKDGIYELELTAVPPEGFATQVISKVTATKKWENAPADLKGVKVLGVGDGAKTAKFDK